MKVVYIHQYFKTPEEGGAIRSFYLARSLAQNGHEVEVITSFNKKRYQIKEVEGFKVHYLPIYYSNHLEKRKRIQAFFKFVWQAFWKAKSLKEIDVYYVSSTPLTVGLIALLLKKITRKQFYFEARDLWPEVPIALGAIQNRFIQKILRYLERRIYQSAEKLIALSPGILEGMKKQVPDRDIFLIPNMSDCEYFSPAIYHAKKEVQLNEQRFYLGEGYLITYFGTLGEANGLGELVNIASWFQGNQISGVTFCLIGDGAEKEFLLQKTQKLHNIHILDAVNKHELKKVLEITDMAYISFLSPPILETTSPNKFFDALAAGKLCILNFKGWLKEIVEQEECGFYAASGYPEVFYEKLKPFLLDENLLKKYQQNARKVAESQFSRHLMEERFLKLF